MALFPSPSSTIKKTTPTNHLLHHPSPLTLMAMIKASLLLAFFFLLFLAGTLARQGRQESCRQMNRINALEACGFIQAEAGVTEFWEPDTQEFWCVGVEMIRHRIQPGGLMLPSYVNTPHLLFTEQGKGVLGVVFPGCPETYESSSEQQFSDPSQRRGPRIQDRHQKVQNLNQGDVVAMPNGAAHWIYNDGNDELVVVVFFDTRNSANQLDAMRRRFYLAGNPHAEYEQQQGQSHQCHVHPEVYSGNIFSGLDVESLQEAFNVDRESAEKLQGQKDQRGHIVKVEQELEFIRPPQSKQEQEREQRGHGNGFEETICSLKLKENIDNPTHVDFVNEQAGRISNLNNYKFPILRHLHLSVARGELYRNAIQSPRYMLNAHNIVYVTHGNMRVQIVNNRGESVFNDELREGQVVVIPQNFAVIKKANEEGARWISFRTNDNAITENLVGRVSAIRSLPVDVVANAYQVSREDAQKLKYNQQQTSLFSPSSSA